MNVLLIACLFLTLLSPVAPLRCLQCYGPPDECTDDNAVEVDCGPNEDTCSIDIMRTKLLGTDSDYVIKSCTQSLACVSGRYSAAALDDFYIFFHLECCQTDLCNKGRLSLPSSTTLIPNGLRCPTCFTLGSANCKANTTVSCLNQETQCVYLAVSVSFAPEIEQFADAVFDVAVQGCGSPNFCAYRPRFVEMAGGLLRVNFTHAQCRNARTYVPEARSPNNFPNAGLLNNPRNAARPNNAPRSSTEK